MSHGVPGRSSGDFQEGPGKSPGSQRAPWELLGSPRALRRRHVVYPNTCMVPQGNMGIKGTSAMSISTRWKRSGKACNSSMGTWAPPSGIQAPQGPWQITGDRQRVPRRGPGVPQGSLGCLQELPRGSLEGPQDVFRGPLWVSGLGPRAPKSGHVKRPYTCMVP